MQTADFLRSLQGQTIYTLSWSERVENQLAFNTNNTYLGATVFVEDLQKCRKLLNESVQHTTCRFKTTVIGFEMKPDSVRFQITIADTGCIDIKKSIKFAI